MIDILVPLAFAVYRERAPEAPPALLMSQVYQESRWNPRARSPVGAVGLTQFMPATWRWVGASFGLGTGDPYDPKDALVWQAVYMKALAKGQRPNTPTCDRWLFALSDYNGGAGWRMKRQKRSGNPTSYFTTSGINPGILLASQRENEHYPRVILEKQMLYARYGTLQCPAPVNDHR